MNDDNVISVDRISKTYRIWENPAARLTVPLLEMISGILPAGERLSARAAARYRDFWALREVDLKIKRGEAIGIIGRNGSGKSTLLQIVAGTLQPSSGSVRLQGRVAALLELGSGFNPEFSGRENVYLNGAVLGLTQQEIDARFDTIAAFADIGDFIDQPVRTYSSGMALRLAFSVIAHIDADVLIIDEALSVGDIYFSQKCARFLHQFRERGTLLFVSHDMSSVRALCDSALWLEKGQVKMSGDAKTVASAYLAESNLSQNNSDVVFIEPAPTEITTVEPLPTPVARTAWQLPRPAAENPIDVGEFNARSEGFGDGRIKILDVRFVSEHGERCSSLKGGDVVTLVIEARGVEPSGNVIFGFILKDRLGQHLFGENTSHGEGKPSLAIHPGETFRAIFVFQLPVLHRGHYTIAAAVASGTTRNHRQQHWLHEALVLTSSLDWAHAGLVGLPMLAVNVEKLH